MNLAVCFLLSPYQFELRKPEPPLSLTPFSPSIRHREEEVFLINDDKWVKIRAEHCTQSRALVTQQNATKPRGSISHGNEIIFTSRQEQGEGEMAFPWVLSGDLQHLSCLYFFATHSSILLCSPQDFLIMVPIGHCVYCFNSGLMQSRVFLLLSCAQLAWS